MRLTARKIWETRGCLLRGFLAVLILVTLPAVMNTTRANLATVQIFHCRPSSLHLSKTGGKSEYERISPPSLLYLRWCGSELEELALLEAILVEVSKGNSDPILRYELSNLYRRLSLENDAAREFAVAFENSPSIRWQGLLVNLGLVEEDPTFPDH